MSADLAVNKERSYRLYDEVFGKGNYAAADELIERHCDAWRRSSTALPRQAMHAAVRSRAHFEIRLQSGSVGDQGAADAATRERRFRVVEISTQQGRGGHVIAYHLTSKLHHPRIASLAGELCQTRPTGDMGARRSDIDELRVDRRQLCAVR